MATCTWVGSTGKACTNTILMDGFCTRHLKQKCPVCWEKVSSTNSSNSKRLTCGHAFHAHCILEWFVTSDECPVCRTKQTNDPIIQFKSKVEENLREKYRDSIHTYDTEIEILNDRIRRLRNLVN